MLPVVDDRRNRAERKRHHRAARHLRFDDDAGDAFGIAGEQEQVDAAEHVLHVVAVSEHVHHGRRGRARVRSRRTSSRNGPVAGDDEVSRQALRADASEHIERAFGPLLFDQVPDEPEQRHVRRERRAPRAAARPARSRSTPTNRSGRRKFADRPDRAAEAERAELVSHLGSEGDGGVDAPAHEAPPRAAARPVDPVVEAEDALPHDERRPAGTRATCERDRAHLHRPAAVREHDVAGLVRAATAGAATPPSTGLAVPFAARSVSGGRAGSDVAVEAGRARAHDVLVSESVERRRELERHELCTAALAPADEVQDAHRQHRATTVPRPFVPVGTRARRRKASTP